MANIFQSIPKNLEAEVFETIIKNDNIELERIISKGHKSPENGWYDQDKNEWVMVVSGSAILAFDNKPDITLLAGDHITIPAHQKHKVTWTEPDIETVWLALFY
ncbi:MAG: cupin domain-containing protein [Psychromonas sp.]|nr:cupin domain-containing protein [Alteromonadales bacterium]MCP5076741.1 cupin domain-containing protein [Psychromonas sp.]